MHEMMLITKKNHWLLTGLLCASVAILSACSALEFHAPPVADASEQTQTVVAHVAPSSEVAKPVVQKLSADQVYRVLAAETLNSKGQPGSAAQVYLELAERYHDASFAQRAYDLAAKAGNGVLLRDASKLNTTLNPNFIESWQVQVVLALRADDVKAAVVAWEAFYQHSIGRGASEKSIFLATASLGQDDIAPATLVAFGDQVAQTHRSAYAAFLQVMLLSAVAQYDAAFDRLMVANQQYPDQAELAQVTASLAIKFADGRGLVWLKDYCERHPEDAVVGEQLGRLYVSLQRLPDARQQFNRLIANHVNLLSARVSLALIELELTHPDIAEGLLLPLVDDRRYRDMARYYLGQAYYLQRKYDAAAAQWLLVQQGNYRLDALVWRAQLLAKQDKWAEAQALLSGFEAADEDEYVRWVQASVRLYGLRHDHQASLALLDKAIISVPEVADLWQERANVKYALGNGKGFEQDMREAMRLAPDDADILNALGFYLADTKQHLVEARRLIERADQLTPNKYYIADSLGWLMHQEGHDEQALVVLNKAYALKADPEILRHRLQVLLALKQRTQAQALAQQEAKQFPDDQALIKFLKQMSLMP